MISRFAVRPYYFVRPRLWREDLRILDQRSFVSFRWRYVFVRIPKAANSSALAALLARFPEDGLDPARIDDAKRGGRHFHTLGPREARTAAGFLTVTVVRDPYARALSAFLDKFRAGDKHLDRYGEAVARQDAGQVTFPGFCRYLAAGGEAENAHWMRQSRIAGLTDRLDMVGRVETLDADLARIFARIAGDGGQAVESPRSGPRPTGARDRLAHYYDAECRALVEQVYAEDFERFGYARVKVSSQDDGRRAEK